MAQQIAIMANAGINLSIFKLCSKVIAKYPITKTINTSDAMCLFVFLQLAI
jgi:hypothetical protein